MLGDSEFVRQALTQSDKSHESSNSMNAHYTLNQLTEDVCRYVNVSPADVKSASKQRHLKQARSMICYIATRNLKTKGIELAKHLNISKSSVSKLVSGFQSTRQYTEFMKIHF